MCRLRSGGFHLFSLPGSFRSRLVWRWVTCTLVGKESRRLFEALSLALPYLSVIAPMAIYQILQDIAAVEGAAAAGDNYDARKVVACDGMATLLCGLAGSVISPVVYALHPPYKTMGARIGFAFWTPIIFIAVVM